MIDVVSTLINCYISLPTTATDCRERDPCETMPHAVSPELNDLFRKILAKDVDTRYAMICL